PHPPQRICLRRSRIRRGRSGDEAIAGSAFHFAMMRASSRRRRWSFFLALSPCRLKLATTLSFAECRNKRISTGKVPAGRPAGGKEYPTQRPAGGKARPANDRRSSPAEIFLDRRRAVGV